MKIGDFLDLVFKEKRMQQRTRTAQKFAIGFAVSAAVGAGITGILVTCKPCRKKLRDLKKEAGDAINDVTGKITDVQEDIVDGYHNIKQDIHKTAENIADSVHAEKTHAE